MLPPFTPRWYTEAVSKLMRMSFPLPDSLTAGLARATLADRDIMYRTGALHEHLCR